MLGQASPEPQIYRIQQTGFDKFPWVPCWHRKSQGEWRSTENANENLIVMTCWLPTWRLVCWTLYIYHGSRGAVRQRPELEEGRGEAFLPEVLDVWIIRPCQCFLFSWMQLFYGPFKKPLPLWHHHHPSPAPLSAQFDWCLRTFFYHEWTRWQNRWSLSSLLEFKM